MCSRLSHLSAFRLFCAPISSLQNPRTSITCWFLPSSGKAVVHGVLSSFANCRFPERSDCRWLGRASYTTGPSPSKHLMPKTLRLQKALLPLPGRVAWLITLSFHPRVLLYLTWNQFDINCPLIVSSLLFSSLQCSAFSLHRDLTF